MIAVLDTSAAVNLALQRPGSDALAEALLEAERVIAPELAVAEITNTFWKYHHIQGMPLTECEAGLEDAIALVDDFTPQAALAAEVFALACHAGRPAYDIFFLVLARRHNGILVTADKKLAELAVRLGIRATGVEVP